MPSWATAEGVGLALHGDGDGTLAWASWEGGGPTRQAGVTTILAARVSPAGTPQVSELTRFPTTWLQDSAVVAADRDGDAVVAWTQSIDPMTTQARLYAALRPQRAAGWGAPELVSSGFQPMAPAVAYPPAGPPTVLFANLVDGIRRQVVVQVATRTE